MIYHSGVVNGFWRASTVPENEARAAQSPFKTFEGGSMQKNEAAEYQLEDAQLAVVVMRIGERMASLAKLDANM